MVPCSHPVPEAVSGRYKQATTRTQAELEPQGMLQASARASALQEDKKVWTPVLFQEDSVLQRASARSVGAWESRLVWERRLCGTCKLSRETRCKPICAFPLLLLRSGAEGLCAVSTRKGKKKKRKSRDVLQPCPCDKRWVLCS